MGTRWDDVTRALISGLRARTGYRSPLDDVDAVPVYDSVEVGMQGESGPAVPLWLSIGYAGDPSAPVESGQGSQHVATLGPARSREESGTVRGTVTAQTGDAVLSGADLSQVGTVGHLRAQAFAALKDVEAYLRSTPGLGVTGVAHLDAWLDSVDSVRPLLAGTRGLVVEVDFTVAYSARI